MTTIGDNRLNGGHGVHEAHGREELLYQSERTRVSRIPRPDGAGSVIRKEPLGPGSMKRLRREAAILHRLSGVEGVPRLAGAPGTAGPLATTGTPGAHSHVQGSAIMFDDVGGVALAEAAAVAMEVPALLDLALELAGIVGSIHRRGVVHKDINPANITICGPQRRPMLIDFDLATTVAEERPGFTHQSQVTGTLSYLAPEQTGRSGHAVDQRADLYALGATLYELATGRPPFGTDQDPLQVIHDHLARVPTPPVELNPALPPTLSAIIMRLLEKEPDRRYQSAEGLAHDLARMREQHAAGRDEPFPLGERDFPLRLAPPSRLVGRDAEIDRLRAAVDNAVHGRARGLLVTGAPGVGKTALIDQLRPMVAARGGWFVSGKFDQHRRDLLSDAVAQAMRSLARLLLAEPEARLAALRSEVLRAVGSNAGLLASVLPEYALLLDITPEVGEGELAESQGRLVQAGLDMLRAVVSPQRPVVIVVDDLQWAGATPIGFVDALLMDDSLRGVLLVGAYREGEVDAAHPLSAMMSRWERLGLAPPLLRLDNLRPSDLGELLADMLRLQSDRAALLAEAVGARTAGNPYDTVELVNALRRDGALVPGDSGWSWDAAALRCYIGDSDVSDLLAARIDRLPGPAQTLLEILACLGGEVDLALAQAATGLSAADLDERLSPSLEDGLLVVHNAGDEGGVRFRHDRVQQAAYERMDRFSRCQRHLALARRLATVPEFASMAAQQYLPAVDAVQDPHERRHVAGVFRSAAADVRLVNYAAAEAYLAAAMRLLSAAAVAPDDPLLAAVEADWHAALYRLGRLQHADEVYQSVQRSRPDPLDLAESACVQISSLTQRGMTREAVALGLDLLRRLGLVVPLAGGFRAEVDKGLDALYRWVAAADQAEDVRRAEISDPRVVAAVKIINRTMPPAFFSDQAIMAWLVTESRRLWEEHGPHAALVCPLSHATVVTIALREDYATGYGAVRHVLAVSEARGYEPETSQARFLFSVSTGHWFEPLEDDIQQAKRAFEGLVHGGDLMFACFTFHTSTPSLLDCAPTLEAYAAEVESGIAFSARTGNEQTNASSVAFRQLVRALRGETDAPGSFTDPSFDEAEYVAGLAANPMAAAYFHITRAQAAALFGDSAELTHHAAAAMPLLPFIGSHYSTARAYLLQALALAERARAAGPAERAAPLAELDACRNWLALRAADAPGNFLHLLELAEAERAWVVGDFRAAASAFDSAMRRAAARQRPWHQALIAERAAKFHLEHGLEYAAQQMLVEARRCYQAWGASGKVRELERAHPFLRTVASTLPRARASIHTVTVSSESIDLLAVLKASQALSSETNLDRLRDRVVDVLSAMTGATAVHVLLRDAERGWFMPSTGGPEEAPLSVDEAAAKGLIPLSAFRYAERTREPLLAEDATRDDRFARDPYVAGLERCSLLVAPILTQGTVRGVLLLENRLSRGVFSADRLDAVMLIAGQLAVSAENAMVYASLEQKVAERTEALAAANHRLELLSITDPLTGLANRRRLDQLLEAEWQRGVRSGTPMAAVMVDIDHFKSYNDHYGHLAGDACLTRVAAALKAEVRETDLVARYGGEEFAILMPGAGLAAARRVAERARAAVEALNEPHESAPAGIVTVSVGVAGTVPSTNAVRETLLADADARLYEAKRTGRNRVMCAERAA